MSVNLYRNETANPIPPDQFFLAKVFTVYNGNGYRIPLEKKGKALVVRGGEAVDVDTVVKGDVVIVPENDVSKIIVSGLGKFTTTERESYDSRYFPPRGVLVKSPHNNGGRREVFVGVGLYDEFMLTILDDCLRLLGPY